MTDQDEPRRSKEPVGPACGQSGQDVPDVEAIMQEIRRAAGTAGPADDAEANIEIGIDEEALKERVLERLRWATAGRPKAAAAEAPPAVTSPPEHIASQFALEQARPRGALHRLLGRVRRWLLRATRIQAELDRLYERLHDDMQDLEQRTSQAAVQAQLWLQQQIPRVREPPEIDAALDDPLYHRFEQRFRGEGPDLRQRLADYLPFLREAATRAAGKGRFDLLDIGCGQGELLALAREEGFVVKGIDANEAMVRTCRDRGLDAERVGLRDFVLRAPEADFRCVTLVHVVEHIPVGHLPSLLTELKRIIAPGGRLLIEIPNIENLRVAASLFWLDYTHMRPLHYETVKFFCRAAGFAGVFHHMLHPCPEAQRLGLLDPAVPGAGQINEVIERLNELLYGAQDVLIVADR